MRNNFLVLTAGILLCSIIEVNDALAQVAASTCRVICPQHAVTRRLLRDAIKADVLSRVDGQRFTNVRVAVDTRRINRLVDSVSIPLNGLLDGVTVENSFHPTGLAFGLSGTSAISLQGECLYDYTVRISATATDLSTNTRVRPVTESLIRIITPLSGTLVCR